MKHLIYGENHSHKVDIENVKSAWVETKSLENGHHYKLVLEMNDGALVPIIFSDNFEVLRKLTGYINLFLKKDLVIEEMLEVENMRFEYGRIK